MTAYATVSRDDPFAASKAMFTALASELAGPAAAGLTASGLEEFLDERGRKVLLQLCTTTTTCGRFGNSRPANTVPRPDRGGR